MQIAYTYEFGKVRNLKHGKCGTRFYTVRSGAVRYKVLVMAPGSKVIKLFSFSTEHE